MEYFYRDGKPAPKAYQTEAGKWIAPIRRICGRCGGAGGSHKWDHTGFTCFDCGGRGGFDDVAKVYTADKLAKLNATQAKAQAKRAAAHAAKVAQQQAEADARRQAFEAEYQPLLALVRPYAAGGDEFIASFLTGIDVRAQISEAQIEVLENCWVRKMLAAEKRAAAHHVGTVGERITLKATVQRAMAYDSNLDAWPRRAFWIVTMDTEDGATVVYKGSSNVFGDKGDRVEFTATVKDHSDYKGVPQTIVARPKVLTHEAAEGGAK